MRPFIHRIDIDRKELDFSALAVASKILHVASHGERLSYIYCRHEELTPEDPRHIFTRNQSKDLQLNAHLIVLDACHLLDKTSYYVIRQQLPVNKPVILIGASRSLIDYEAENFFSNFYISLFSTELPSDFPAFFRRVISSYRHAKSSYREQRIIYFGFFRRRSHMRIRIIWRFSMATILDHIEQENYWRNLAIRLKDQAIAAIKRKRPRNRDLFAKSSGDRI